MKRMLTLTCLALVSSLMAAGNLVAQDLVITNARILDGSGGEIPQGTIVVRGGQIASIGAGRAAGPAGATEIDAQHSSLSGADELIYCLGRASIAGRRGYSSF